jgi:ribonuclease HI
LEGLSVIQHGNNLRNLTRWDQPPQGWCKINFDGASKGNLGMAGCRVIIRNMNGDSLWVMIIPIGEQKNHMVEASVALYGLSYAKSMNLDKIWLEGDSLNIINCLIKINNPSLKIHNIICKAIYLINSFEICVITHNYRETNHVADWAANVACKSHGKLIWKHGDNIPIKGLSLIKYDKVRSRKFFIINDEYGNKD